MTTTSSALNTVESAIAEMLMEEARSWELNATCHVSGTKHKRAGQVIVSLHWVVIITPLFQRESHQSLSIQTLTLKLGLNVFKYVSTPTTLPASSTPEVYVPLFRCVFWLTLSILAHHNNCENFKGISRPTI